MLHHVSFKKPNIAYVRASEPFSLDELFSLLASSIGDGRDAPTHPRPAIVDFRQVDLDRIETSEIRRHTMKKSAFDVKFTSFPCAYVVSGLPSFSVVRMANVFSELAGVTPEDQTFVTEELPKAVEWLVEKLGENQEDIPMLLEEMALRGP